MAQGETQDGTAKKGFDFEAAVADARRDYPKQTEKITFIDTSSPDADEKLLAWANMAGKNQRQFDAMMQHKESNSAFAGEGNGHKLIALPTRRGPDEGAFPGDEAKSAYFSFQHELGHFVVPNAHATDSDASTEHREHAADTFAVLRGLKQGVFSKADVVTLGDGRCIAMLLTQDITHLTTMSLDAVAINPKNIDFISLSEKDVLKIAQKHADAFEMSYQAESRFASIQGIDRRGRAQGRPLDEIVEEKMMKLQETAMSSPAHSQKFYLAARVLNTALETGHFKYAGQEVKVDVTTDYWKSVKEALHTKAGDRDIGARKALQTEELTREGDKPSNFLQRVKQSVTPLKI
ncbi:MAG: hypothetical protein GC185_12455 [Alphaproteobacteria bacterium]|nr:hypothetical protein [Alphaproteobacteria bacterium]